MRPGRIAGLSVFLAAALAEAAIVGGGGSRRSDCLAVWSADVNHPPAKPKGFRCTDGAPCDADGEVNGECRFDVAVCANSTFDPRCPLAGVRTMTVHHAVDDGDPKFDPEFQALQSRIDSAIDPPNADPDRCTLPASFHVQVTGPLAGNACRRGRKLVRLEARSDFLAGKQYKDGDRLRLECDPAPAGCDPLALYDGTFDRIQRQVFDRSCAVSGCHDSQTQQAGLLLETGSSYANLVDQDPSNAAALAAGWKRVDAANASAASSYLWHKLTGDLPPGAGGRMPLGRPPLDAVLVDVIRLWIEAGAPTSGWVPGTY